MKNFIPIPSAISVLIVDDHPMFRSGLRSALNTIPYIHHVFEAENGMNAILKMKAEPANIILMDIRMPGIDGIQTTIECQKLFPETKIIGLSMIDDGDSILRMIDSGASGYLLKSADKNEIDMAIRVVINGNNYFSPEVNSTLTKIILSEKNKKEDLIHPELRKDRLRDVLYLICREFTNAEIGKRLYLSPRSIEYYRRIISEISGARSPFGVMKFAQQNGILEDKALIKKWDELI